MCSLTSVQIAKNTFCYSPNLPTYDTTDFIYLQAIMALKEEKWFIKCIYYFGEFACMFEFYTKFLKT